MKIKKTFKLFANCKVVKGISQATICDLHRGSVYSIPLSLALFLEKTSANITYDVLETYLPETQNTILEYLDHFVKKELGFWTDDPDSFPDLNLKWSSPEVINNAIIEIDKIESKHLEKIANSLVTLLCKFIEIRVYKLLDINKICNFLNRFQDSTLKGVIIYIPYTNEQEINNLKRTLLTNPLISLIIIHSATIKKLPKSILTDKIKLISKKINSNSHCGVIDPNLFSIKIPVFTESHQFNSCLNKKIAIDLNGSIKNCPSMLQDFGNIKNTSLEDVVNNKDFRKHWTITKDQIKGCKNCEFRYICTDCRAYTENPNDIFSKPLKCGYDPQTNTWSEWSKNPLKKETIHFYKL